MYYPLFIIIFIVIIIFIILLYSQKLVYSRINNEMNILQIYDPSPETLFNLYNQNQPIIIQQELQHWDGFQLLLGLDYDTIKLLTKENTQEILTIIKGNMQYHNNIFSYNWTIDINRIDLTYESPIFVIKQNNLLQLFSTITGEARIILICPKEINKLGKFINNVSDKDITDEINKDDTELEYIEIVLREGNMIFIPYDWFYFIYSNDEETVLLNCVNESLINLLK
jgi:hypothetical protein